MGGYRQWTLPHDMDNDNQSLKNIKQCQRFKITLDNWEKALSEGKDTIVVTDDNIDTHIDVTHNKLYKIICFG